MGGVKVGARVGRVGRWDGGGGVDGFEETEGEGAEGEGEGEGGESEGCGDFEEGGGGEDEDGAESGGCESFVGTVDWRRRGGASSAGSKVENSSD